MENNTKLSLKDIYGSYWHCLDFEVSHLWQRSIFLTTFLVLCFTAYGMLVQNMLEGLKNSETEISISYWLVTNMAAIAIGVIGTCFSCFWIMMIKSSKAWYEFYRKAIEVFERNLVHRNAADAGFTGINSFNPLGLHGYDIPPHDKKLSTGKPGTFSLAGINWAIGWLALKIWQVLICVHIAILSFLAVRQTACSVLLSIVLVVLSVALSCLLSHIFARHIIEWKKLGSGTLEERFKGN